MSEYYLADLRAKERAGQRDRERQRGDDEPRRAADIKMTLLGDFLFPSGEPQGCDPYNATNGKAVLDAWKLRRDRR